MPFPQKIMRKHVYAPVGRCIYCGDGGGKNGLRLEHIIPGGIGGRLELPNSSCQRCEQETHAFEGRVISQMYGDVRAHFGVRREKKTKRRWPETVPVDVTNGTDTWTVDVPINDQPILFCMITMPPPGILVRRTKDEFGFPDAMLSTGDPTGDLEKNIGKISRRLPVGTRVSLNRGGLHTDELGRFLAKIAHAYAVAERGISAFEPFLLNAILNRRPMYLSHYIGEARDAVTTLSPDLHELSLREEPNGEKWLLVVRVHLFADIGVQHHGHSRPSGMPAYDVVVGELV
jgi:hypothetical protein